MSILKVVSEKMDKVLRTTTCEYYTPDTIKELSFTEALTPYQPEPCDLFPEGFKENELPKFDGYFWTRWTSNHWIIPLVACAIYIPMVFLLPKVMATREKMRLQPLVIGWNFGLSFFSFAGVVYCVPQLLFGEHAGLLSRGFYPSVCSHASYYGMGDSGFFVFLFIYSKLAELLDTFFLLVRKSPVILLHWYHHVTVLLYCWHSYSARIGTGLWFAAMNYTVHSIMYFYFGLTQCGPAGRKIAKKFAMMITTIQLLQMVMGIVVTVASVVYHYNGHTCYVSLHNSALGLVMYSSYFVLFLQLFLNHYVFNKKATATKALPSNKCPPTAEMANAADATMKGKNIAPVDVNKKM